jgi:SAM-dependent methyltransferase
VTLYTTNPPDAPSRRYRVVRCASCGVARTDPPPPVGVREAFYDADYGGGATPKLVGPVERVRRAFARARARAVVRGLPAGSRVLDVGCGDGKLVVALLDRGMRAIGLEGSTGPRLRASANTGHRVFASDAGRLPFGDGALDVVVIWHVLEHLPEPERAIAEVVRCLRPGGTLVVAVPDLNGLASRIGGAAWLGLDVERHLYHFTPRGLEALLARQHLVVRRRRHMNLELTVIDLFDSTLRRLGLGRLALYDQLGTGSRRGARLLATAALAVVGLPCALVAALVAGTLGYGTDVQLWADKGTA